MDYLLDGYLCLWFESLYKCKIAEGLKYEEEAMAEAIDSDSNLVGFT